MSVRVESAPGHDHSHGVRLLGGILLVAALALSGCSRAREPASPPTSARVVTVEVGGMVCAACVAKVQAQLERVPGVHDVRVSLGDQRATMACDPSVADTALTAAVRRAGPDYVGLVLH